MTKLHNKEKHIKKITTGEYTTDEKPLIKNKNHLKTVKNYVDLRRIVDKVNYNTIDADLISILHLSNYLKDKKFKDATRKDIMDFSKYLKEKHDLTDSTISLYLMKLKRFYKYVSKPDMYANGKMDQKDIKYPDSVRWISYDDNGDELPLDNIPSMKEIKKLFNSCKDVRDQVILVSLLDGGLRKSELIKLKIRNVKFNDKLKKFYFVLPKKQGRKKINYKTAKSQRHVQLFLISSSTAYIKDYLNHHRFKNNPDAPFIYTEDKSVKGSDPDDFMIGEMGISEIINRIVKDSGLKYHITPHTLRHISATWSCKKGFNEPMLRDRYGWSNRSKMPSRYVHLVNADMENKIGEILGITTDETEIDEMQPKVCWNCKEDNPFSYNYCFKCGVELRQKEKPDVTATDIGILMQKTENSELLEEKMRGILEKLLEEKKTKEKTK